MTETKLVMIYFYLCLVWFEIKNCSSYIRETFQTGILLYL